MHTGSRSLLAVSRFNGGGSVPAALHIGLRLLIPGLAGAALVHLAAYHVPLDRPLSPQWMAAARDLLVQCPLALPLGAIGLAFLLAVLHARAEVSRLERLNAALARLLASRSLTIPSTHEVAPRSAVRLVLFIGGVLTIQLVALGLFDLICPMQVTMVMGGAVMAMPMAPVLPMLPVHLLIAAMLGAAVWRLERRMIRLRARIVWWLRLLGWGDARQSNPPPVSLRFWPRAWYGYALFARPPPLSTRP